MLAADMKPLEYNQHLGYQFRIGQTAIGARLACDSGTARLRTVLQVQNSAIDSASVEGVASALLCDAKCSPTLSGWPPCQPAS